MDFYYEGSEIYYMEGKDSSQWPHSGSSVWILGREYNSESDIEDLDSQIESRLLFTYRKGFSEIGETGYTSDSGWGCMLRCGQMVLGEALQRIVLGRDWRWSAKDAALLNENDKGTQYVNLLQLFEDSKVAPYSIHQIALMGESIQSKKPVGTWFGPNTIAQVIRKLSVFEKNIPIGVHIALDNTVIVDEVKHSCYIQKENGPDWKPLLLFIPLRLGLTEINPMYIKDLKECFEFPQCLGVIGGRPNHALFFVGYVDNEIIYLDPHVSTQSFVRVEKMGGEADKSYHTKNVSRMNFLRLDPSLSLCFICHTEAEFDDLCQNFLFKLIRGHTSPFFEICRERPGHLEPATYNMDLPNIDPDENTGKEYEKVRSHDTSDDDFEIL